MVLVIPTHPRGYPLLRAGASSWRAGVPAVIVTDGEAEGPTYPYGDMNESSSIQGRSASGVPGGPEGAVGIDWGGERQNQELWFSHPRTGARASA